MHIEREAMRWSVAGEPFTHFKAAIAYAQIVADRYQRTFPITQHNADGTAHIVQEVHPRDIVMAFVFDPL